MINKIYINREGKATYDEYEWIPVDYYPIGGYFHINDRSGYVYEDIVNEISTNTFQDLREYMMVQ